MIYENNNVVYGFIHIPKNGGKYIRNQLIQNKQNKIIKVFWDIKDSFDMAHIPYIKMPKPAQFHSYSRNPYDRIISAFFYKNPGSTIQDFKTFCKETLIHYDFNLSFPCEYIHYYPQYLFVCDHKLTIRAKIEKIENFNPSKYIYTEYFDDKCIQIINKIYRLDFLLFGYNMIT
jgi:hypothetical protein